MRVIIWILGLIVSMGCKALPIKENIFYESNAERNLTKVDNLERDLILEAERY